jgi:hypothetical protein
VTLDELETYVESRRNNPWTIALAIHRKSSFCLHGAAGPLPRRRGKGKNEAEPPLIGDEERRWRNSGSRLAVAACAEALRPLVPRDAILTLDTDRKHSYVGIFRKEFGTMLVHRRTSSKARRDWRNPLFKVNVAFAMLRDGVSRLVRETWAAAKRSDRLIDHVYIWIAYRNFVRGVSNPCWHETPAMQLGITSRKLAWGELFRWREDFAADLLRV